MDVQVTMSSSRSSGRKALADFFSCFNSQRAHWYSIIISSSKMSSTDAAHHFQAFPSLGKVASVAEDFMQDVLLHCGLVMFRRGSGHAVLIQQWQSFILEHQLSEIEVTHFTVGKKRRIYVRLGTWNGITHKPRTPFDIWSSALAGTLRVPRVCTSLLSRTLAEAIGSLDLVLSKDSPSIPTASTQDSSSSAESESEESLDDEEDKKPPMINVSSQFALDPVEYPLLSALVPVDKGLNLFDRLLNEIVRYYNTHDITFIRGNNAEATLIAVSSFRSLPRYGKRHEEAELIS